MELYMQCAATFAIASLGIMTLVISVAIIKEAFFDKHEECKCEKN